MPDDLESILSDVDNTHTFQNAQAEEKRVHEQEMRKGDRVVVDKDDAAAEKNFLARVSKEQKNNALEPFRKGYIKALGTHNEIMSQFREMTSDKVINDVLAGMMKKYRYTFSRSIEGIEKTFSEFLTSYSPEMISKKNRQDFYLFFSSEDMNQNRLNFLLLKELFVRLREFNSRFRRDWDELQKGIGVINLVTEGKSTYTVCSGIIADALSFCEKTDQFVRFLGIVIGIGENDLDVLDRDIGNKIIYFESFDYSYDKIFSSAIDAPDEDSTGDDDIFALDMVPVPKERPRKIAPSSSPVETSAPAAFSRSDSYSSNFTIRGTSTWNRVEPYIIRIDGSKIVKDTADLESTVYFNREIPDTVKVNGIVKRAMMRYMKNASSGIRTEYAEFIFRTVSVQVREIAEYLGVPDERKDLLTYHLGPLTIARLLNDLFTDTQVGLCYKILSDNRVARFIPSEFIREKTLDWFEQNINGLDLPFDRVSDFSEFKRIAQEKYNTDRDISLQKIDRAVEQYLQKTGKKLDRDAMLKSKAKELFGARMMIVYNRFLDRTVFK